MSVDHVAVVPVKSPGVAKSRLTGVSGTARGQLARAFATDTVRACLTAECVAHVLVVTEDAGFAEQAASLGAMVTGEDGARGLNEALCRGASVAREYWPGGRPFALCADLPALRPGDLDVALAHLGAPRAGAAFVVDAAGTGTTLYSAAYDGFAPRFGTGSARAHHESGAQALTGELTSLRQDVDDADDLVAAVAQGVGPATRAALAHVPGLNAVPHPH